MVQAVMMQLMYGEVLITIFLPLSFYSKYSCRYSPVTTAWATPILVSGGSCGLMSLLLMTPTGPGDSSVVSACRINAQKLGSNSDRLLNFLMMLFNICDLYGFFSFTIKY